VEQGRARRRNQAGLIFRDYRYQQIEFEPKPVARDEYAAKKMWAWRLHRKGEVEASTDALREHGPLLQLTLMEVRMNKDQIKGGMKDIAGKVQQKTGELTGNKTQQIKGVKNQAEGKLQKGVGDAKETLRDADRATKP
jgi:uncharacterized protein YjbJ (UPF0337 family)